MQARQNREGLWEQEIDGQKYEFSKWGAEESLRTLLKLGKVVGRPMGLVLGSMAEGSSLDSVLDRKLNGDVLATAMDALMNSMDEQSCFDLIQKLSTQNVFCKGTPIRFDTHYQDRLMHLFKVVKAALEVQYGNFTDAILGGVRVQNRADPQATTQDK